MFSAARIKLTLSYTAFFALVILLFSGAFYGLQSKTIRTTHRVPIWMVERVKTRFPTLDPEQHRRVIEALDEQFETVTDELLEELFKTILLLDLISILVCFGISYILAGLTLAPIEKAYRHQQQFLQDASHELRTPLAVMRSEIEVDLRQKKKPSPQKHAHVLQSLLEEVQTMSSLVDDILLLARSNQSPAETKSQDHDIDINQLLTEVAEDFQQIAHQKKLQIITKGSAKTRVFGSQQDWERLLRILVDNAIKYTDSGSITLEVLKSSQRAGRKVIVRVSDTGRGIAKSETQHIFDRFYRTETERSSPGSGLGLAIAKTLVEKLHGSITVKSELGTGSTFEIKVPLKS